MRKFIFNPLSGEFDIVDEFDTTLPFPNDLDLNCNDLINTGNILPCTTDTYDLGSSSLKYRSGYFNTTLFLNNDGGVSQQYPTAVGTGSLTDYTINVGGGGDATEGGQFTIMFEDSDILSTGANILNVDLGAVSLFTDAGAGSGLRITAPLGGTVGNIIFDVGAAGLLASDAGTLFILSNTGTAKVTPLRFKNEAGRLMTFECDSNNAGGANNVISFGQAIGSTSLSGIRTNFRFRNHNTSGFGGTGVWHVVDIDPVDVAWTNSRTHISSLRITAHEATSAAPVLASTLFIQDAPTTGSSDNNAIYVAAGKTRLDGRLDTRASKLTGKVRTTSATYNDASAFEEYFCNTDSNAIQFNLDVGIDRRRVRIVNTGTSGNDVTITPDGSENLLGANSSFTLADGESLIIVFDTNDGWW